MKQLILERTDYLPGGTRGVLLLPGGDSLFTIENPWVDNKQLVSCIPEGRYVCTPRPYYRGGYDTFEVTGVPDRDLILFHVANTERDVDGCIGVGLKEGTLRGLPAVLSSRPAFFDVFYPAVKEFSTFELLVKSLERMEPLPPEQITITDVQYK